MAPLRQDVPGRTRHRRVHAPASTARCRGLAPRPWPGRAIAILVQTVLAVGALPTVAAAQPSTAFGPSMTFIGGGVGVTSSAAEGRVQATAFPEGSLLAPRIEAGLALGRRVGLGLAFVPFTEINGSHNIALLAVSDRQREQAWVAELRLRAGATPRVAMDVVGGAGLLRQQREGTFACNFTCAVANTAEPSHTSPAFSVGLDVPLQLGPHLSLAALGRIYWMRRGRLDVNTWPRNNTVESAAFLTLRLTR